MAAPTREPRKKIKNRKKKLINWLRTHDGADTSANRSKDGAERAVSENDNAFYKYLN